MKDKRYTIKMSLNIEETNDTCGEKNITFYNEDNALDHIIILGEFFDLLLENKSWGTTGSNDELVERILKPIREKIEPPKKKEVA